MPKSAPRGTTSSAAAPSTSWPIGPIATWGLSRYPSSFGSCVGISQGKLSRKFSEIWNLNKSIANIVLTVYIENIINTATISGIVVLHSPKAGMEGKEKEIWINSSELGWSEFVWANSSLWYSCDLASQY